MADVTLFGVPFSAADFRDGGHLDLVTINGQSLERFLAALYAVGLEANAMKGVGAISTTSLAIGTGTRAFTFTPTTQAWDVGQVVRAASLADPANYMVGDVTATGSGTVTLNVTITGGSGTHADWYLGTPAPGLNLPMALSQGGTGATTAAAAAAALGVKRIRQMQVGTLATAFSTASASAVDTGLQVTITPQSATSRVLLICSYAGGIALNKVGGSDHYAWFWLEKDGTSTLTQVRKRLIADVNGGANNAGVFDYETQVYVDAPGDTSAHTYKLRTQTDGQTTTNAYVNAEAGSATQVAHIIAIEVDA